MQPTLAFAGKTIRHRKSKRQRLNINSRVSWVQASQLNSIVLSHLCSKTLFVWRFSTLSGISNGILRIIMILCQLTKGLVPEISRTYYDEGMLMFCTPDQSINVISVEPGTTIRGRTKLFTSASQINRLLFSSVSCSTGHYLSASYDWSWVQLLTDPSIRQSRLSSESNRPHPLPLIQEKRLGITHTGETIGSFLS